MPSSIAAVQAAIEQLRHRGLPVTPPIANQQRPIGDGSPLSAGEGLGVKSSKSKKTHSNFDALIQAASAREGIDPTLVKAVARAESGLDANAVSAAGAKGVMQLMDGTARSLGVKDSFDPAQNIAGGAKYLKQMLTRYGGDVKRAVAAYNAGPGAVDASGGIPPYAETQSYVQRVLQLRDSR